MTTPLQVEVYLFHKKRKRPRPSFTYVADGLEVAFTDTSTKNPVTYLWDFGDGNTSTLQNPVHTYAEAGEYTVTLTAFNRAGGRSTSQAVTVEASELSAFHQAVVAAGFSNFYDLTLGDATNYGAAGASQNGTVTGGTFSAGGWTTTSLSESIDLPAQSFTSGTFCILATAIGTPDPSETLAMISNESGCTPAGVLSGQLQAYFEAFTPAMSAIAGVTPAPISVEKILIVGRYNHTSGIPELRYAISTSLISPTLTTFVQQAGGEIFGDHSFIFGGSIGADGTLVEAIFYHTDYLNDAALQPILDAIGWT